MTIKTLVAFALFIVAFLVGSIFLINFLKASSFVYLYFAFSFLLLIGIGLSLRKKYPENIRFLFLIIPILLIALSLSFFGSSMKNYLDKSKNFDILSVHNLESTNDYYRTYMDFLGSEILKSRAASLDLQQQIDNLIARQNAAGQETNPVPDTTQNTTLPIIIGERDEEEQDD